MCSFLNGLIQRRIWIKLKRIIGSVWGFYKGMRMLAMPILRSEFHVYYGYNNIPGVHDIISGGFVKIQRMQAIFPNSPQGFNILYLVSSFLPEGAPELLWVIRRKGVRVVWNQNGVAYPAWYGEGWKKVNEPMAKMVQGADYVFYQSEFCKKSADLFLGERSSGQILYNSVDTTVFTPTERPPDSRNLVLLLSGTHRHYYRFSTAVKTLYFVRQSRPNTHLLVAGSLKWRTDKAGTTRSAERLLKELGLEEWVTFIGPYTQADAPLITRQAHLLLHTQYNDACPSLVVEAMACGLPVVYSNSGGVPELVGQEAGIGIPTELSWERIIPPDPEAMAHAVLKVADRWITFSQAARQRAVEKFDLGPWLERHREVFEGLLRTT